MSPELQDRLIIIPFVTGIFAMLSFGFALLVGGATRRFRTVGICSTIFIAGMGYCMSWRKDLEALFGMRDAWIMVTVAVAIGATYLCKMLLRRKQQSAITSTNKQSPPAQM